MCERLKKSGVVRWRQSNHNNNKKNGEGGSQVEAEYLCVCVCVCEYIEDKLWRVCERLKTWGGRHTQGSKTWVESNG